MHSSTNFQTELMPGSTPGKWVVVHCPSLHNRRNKILLTLVLGSENNKFLAKEESNPPASQQFGKEPQGRRKLRTEREETSK